MGLQTNVLNNYAVGVLHDEVRQMYRGNVYMQGNAWVRPRHLMHLVDAIRQISGPVEVKEVTHSFSPRGGFVTTWVPDCVAFAHDTQKLGIVTRALSTTAQGSTAYTWAPRSLRANNSLLLKSGLSKSLRFFGRIDETVGRRAGAIGNYGFYQVKRLGRGLFNATPYGKRWATFTRGFKDPKNLFKVGTPGVVNSDVNDAFDSAVNKLFSIRGSLRHGGTRQGPLGDRQGDHLQRHRLRDQGQGLQGPGQDECSATRERPAPFSSPRTRSSSAPPTRTRSRNASWGTPTSAC